jgi:hypothetical protein
MQTQPEIVIGIPGQWPTRSDLVKDIANRSGGYLFAGMILMHVATGEAFSLEVYDHDPNLAEIFAITGGGSH